MSWVVRAAVSPGCGRLEMKKTICPSGEMCGSALLHADAKRGRAGRDQRPSSPSRVSRTSNALKASSARSNSARTPK
jgi:hypothetical protein